MIRPFERLTPLKVNDAEFLNVTPFKVYGPPTVVPSVAPLILDVPQPAASYTFFCIEGLATVPLNKTTSIAGAALSPLEAKQEV